MVHRQPKTRFRADRRGEQTFTYTVAQDTRNDVLVLANEDYEGYNQAGNRTGADPADAPRYLQTYVDDLARAGGSPASTWDVSAQGVPHDLGVLGRFDAVVWISVTTGSRKMKRMC